MTEHLKHLRHAERTIDARETTKALREIQKRFKQHAKDHTIVKQDEEIEGIKS